MSDKSKDEKKEGEQAAKGSNSMVIIAVAVLVTACISAGGVYFFMQHKTAAALEEHGVKAKEPKKYFPFPDALLILLQPDKADATGKYLNVKITVAYEDEGTKMIIEKNMPLIKNDIITTLSKFTGQQALTGEGRGKMQKELMDTFNKILKEADKAEGEKSEHKKEGKSKEKTIEALYFIEFIVQ